LAGTKIYVNGVSQSLTDTSGTLTSGATSTVPFRVGSRSNATSFYSGNLAFMSVFNSSFTSTQVGQFCALGPQ
jgi:hypothetical protein